MKYDDPKITDQLAAEYVLGTLEGRARWRFERLLTRDLALKSRVESWDLRLNTLASRVPEVPPPPGAWERIFAQIAPVPEAQTERGAIESLAFWRRLAASASLAVLIMGMVLLWPEPELDRPMEAGYVVMLRDDYQRTSWVINAPPSLREFTVSAAAPTPVPEGKRCYLWLQPQGNGELVNLGALPDDGNTTLTVPESIRALLPGHLLVSMEEASDTLPPKPSNDLNMQVEWMKPIQHTF